MSPAICNKHGVVSFSRSVNYEGWKIEKLKDSYLVESKTPEKTTTIISAVMRYGILQNNEMLDETMHDKMSCTKQRIKTAWVFTQSDQKLLFHREAPIECITKSLIGLS